jgi:hypothetical protein
LLKKAGFYTVSVAFLYFAFKIYNRLKKAYMAKQADKIIKISGKYGDAVYVNGKKYGYSLRKAPVAGVRKDEPALVQQYSRTKFLNALAGELNNILKGHFPLFKAAGFYHTAQKCLRREPQNNRFLLLRQLKGLDLNPAYPMSRLGGFNLVVKAAKRRITVLLGTVVHPPKGAYKADCYYYEVLLACWDKGSKPAAVDWQLSDWIPIAAGMPEFEFAFAVAPETVHWLVCVRQQLGIKGQELEMFAAEAVQIVDAGSFDKRDAAILEKRMQAKAGAAAAKPATGALRAMKRVPAKRIL